jgi:cell pole-organizing protein PopZ
MAQPNVVREPSMDEILASIRRIIESNDPVPQAGVATSMAEPEGFMGRPANDDSEEVTLTVDDAFARAVDDFAATEPPIMAHPLRPEATASAREPAQLQRVEPSFHSTPVEAQPQPKSLSLADVAARVRAASERGQAERIAALQDLTPEPVAVEPLYVAPEREPEPVFASSPAPEPVMSEPERSVERMEVQAEAHVEPEPVSQQPISLLSSSVGEQVARSFQDLAFAVDDAERRSLDQITEDMLRPMLQEWLDDNLPTMVERLVREEIERVR